MPQFNINNLVVLHLYNYAKPKGERDPLALIEKKCQAIRVSTCMRVIYILNKDALVSEEQVRAYQSLTDYLNRNDFYARDVSFERLDGAAGYQFLLYWILGGVNPKRKFDDTRILGDVRAIWNKMLRSTSSRVEEIVPIYTSFFHSLFADSMQLAPLIERYKPRGIAELEQLLQRACQNCCWARIHDFLSCSKRFDYQSFAEATHLHQLKESLLAEKEKILNKVMLSPSDNKICFFKAQPDVSEEQINGVSLKIEKINRLLECLSSWRLESSSLVFDSGEGEAASSTPVDEVSLQPLPALEAGLSDDYIPSAEPPQCR